MDWICSTYSTRYKIQLSAHQDLADQIYSLPSRNLGSVTLIPQMSIVHSLTVLDLMLRAMLARMAPEDPSMPAVATAKTISGIQSLR